MIWADGQEWGTDREVAQRLTLHDPTTGDILDLVTPGMVRRWHDRHGLRKVRMRGTNGRWQVVYPVAPASIICRDTGDTPQGRPRQLDLVPAAA